MSDIIVWGTRSADHDMDQRITERRWDVWGDADRPYPAEPKWWRGEIRTRGRRIASAKRRGLFQPGDSFLDIARRYRDSKALP